jgi:hypothetical protein
MKARRILSYIICFGSLLFFNACFEDPEVRLLQSDKELVDSLYSASIDSLQLIVDSLCLEQRELIYTALVDSFKQVRLAEIEEFLN